jgi:hypothetical protein
VIAIAGEVNYNALMKSSSFTVWQSVAGQLSPEAAARHPESALAGLSAN